MKQFFKFMFATVAGIFLTGILFSILGIVMLAGVLASSDAETNVAPNSVFVLKLKGTLEERAVRNPLAKFLGEERTEIGLDDVLTSIRKAKTNPDIKGVFLDMDGFGASYATASLQAIRRELVDYKKSGKALVAYAGNYSQGGYYLATVADEVWMNHIGTIGWHGLSLQLLFMKDALDKLGVKMQVFRVGTYKSAVEPYISTQMSPANREQLQAFVDQSWKTMVTEVAASRKISADSLQAFADRYMDLQDAKVVEKYRLVDKLGTRLKAAESLCHKIGVESTDKMSQLNLDDMINVSDVTLKPKNGNAIAVYYAYGAITDEETSSMSGSGIVGDKMVRDLHKLSKDDDIKAVVLRINSPGGSAYASEQIWGAVQELKAKKPVVVSMGDYAASGGYYIASAASRIIAESNTLTGSIGVFGMMPEASELINNKLGVHIDGVKTAKYADMGQMVFGGVLPRPMTEDEQALMQQQVNRIYDLFLTRCSSGRKINRETIGRIAEGRVWSGAKALELKLVDELGGLDRAVAVAAKMVKVKDYSLITYPEKKDPLWSLLEDRADNYIQGKVETAFGGYYNELQVLQNLLKEDRLQARLPYFINIR